MAFPTLTEIRRLVRRGHSATFSLDEAVDLPGAWREARRLRQELPADLLVLASPGSPASLRILQLVSDAEAAGAAPRLQALLRDFRTAARQLVECLRAEVLPAYEAGDAYRDQVTLGCETWSLAIHGEHCRFESAVTGQVVEANVGRPDDVDPYFLLEYARTSTAYAEVLSVCREGFHDMCRLLDLAEADWRHGRGV